MDFSVHIEADIRTTRASSDCSRTVYMLPLSGSRLASSPSLLFSMGWKCSHMPLIMWEERKEGLGPEKSCESRLLHVMMQWYQLIPTQRLGSKWNWKCGPCLWRVPYESRIREAIFPANVLMES